MFIVVCDCGDVFIVIFEVLLYYNVDVNVWENSYIEDIAFYYVVRRGRDVFVKVLFCCGVDLCVFNGCG